MFLTDIMCFVDSYYEKLNPNAYEYKLALLWGEAQKKIAYSYLKVT